MEVPAAEALVVWAVAETGTSGGQLQPPVLEPQTQVVAVEAQEVGGLLAQPQVLVVLASLSFDTQYRSNKWHILQKYKMA